MHIRFNKFLTYTETKINSPHALIITSGFYIVLLISVLVSLSDYQMSRLFSSDSLYLPSIYLDVIERGNPFKGWYLNGAPNFFPDMLFYFIIHFFTDHFILSSFVYAIFQNIIIILLAFWMFRLLSPYRAYQNSVVAISLLMACLLSGHYAQALEFRFHLYINSFHTSAFLMTLLSFNLLMSWMKQKKYIFLFLLFLSIYLASISDKLYILYFIVPTVIFWTYLVIKEYSVNKLLAIGVLLISTLLGIITFNYLRWSGTFRFVNAGENIDGIKILQSVIFFIQTIVNYLNRIDISTVIIMLALTSIFIGSTKFIKDLNKKNINELHLITLLIPVSILIFPVITGNFTDISLIRYNIFGIYLLLLTLPILASYSRFSRLALLLPGLLNIVLAFSVIYNTNFNCQWIKKMHYKPAHIDDFDYLVRKHNLTKGIASYWKAKETMMFSDENTELYSVFNSLSPYKHVNHPNHFIGKKPFDFILLSGNIDTTIVSNKFENEEIIKLYTNDIMILKTPKFKFSRNNEILIIRN